MATAGSFGVGFQPQAVILFMTTLAADGFGAPLGFGMGFGVSATSRRAVAHASDDNALTANAGRSASTTKILQIPANGTPSLDAEADLVSLDADGFTVNWTTAPAIAYVVHYVALAGLENVAIGTLTEATGGGNQAVTGLGFQPNFLLFMSDGLTADDTTSTRIQFGLGAAAAGGTRGATCVFSEDGSVGSETSMYQRSDRCIVSVVGDAGTVDAEADIVSFDSGGFTVNWTVTPVAADKVYFLAIRGGEFVVGAETQATSAGRKLTTGLPWQPGGLLAFGTNRAASASSAAGHKLSLGAADTLGDGGVWEEDVDALGLTDANVSTVRGKVLRHATSPSTIDADAELAEFTSDGYTLNWPTADGTAREFIYLAALVEELVWRRIEPLVRLAAVWRS